MPASKLLLAVAVGAAVGATAAAPAPAETDALSARYWQAWLAEVDHLLGPAERQAFAALSDDGERHAFVREFWRVRDPVPDTPQNELRDIWDFRTRQATLAFGGLDDVRSQHLLLLGTPLIRRFVCHEVTAEIYYWEVAGRQLAGGFVSFDGEPFAYHPRSQRVMAAFRRRRCPYDPLYRAWMSLPSPRRLVRISGLPAPDASWLTSFAAAATAGEDVGMADVAVATSFTEIFSDGARLEIRLRLPHLPSPPAGRDPRLIPTLDLRAALVGAETVRPIRHRFYLPPRLTSDEIDLVASRIVGPAGAGQLLVELVQEGGGVLHRELRDLEVPAPESVSRGVPVPRPTEPIVGNNVADLALRPRLRIEPPKGAVVGRTPIALELTGRGVETVHVLLDGRQAAVVRGRPLRPVLDFGRDPRPREVEAVGFDAAGREVARARARVNESSLPFKLLLRELARDAAGDVSVSIDVEGPASAEVDRVEVYAEETLEAVVRSLPARQVVPADATGRINYVRAVAFLADGRRAEEVLAVDLPGTLESFDVDLVELYATAVDAAGRPVLDLAAGDVRVVEDGVGQRVRELQAVESVPLTVAVLMDNSGSMEKGLADARASAKSFFASVLRSGDTATFLTFNHEPRLVVPLTSEAARLDAGIDAVSCWGGTALWDSVLLALYYFQGLPGHRALVVLTDGVDEHSRLEYEDLLDSAVRSGTSIYAVSMGPGREIGDAERLAELARATGGRHFRIASPKRLAPVYDQIREELHTQYRITYQSSSSGAEFRRVEVTSRREGISIRTGSGYFP